MFHAIVQVSLYALLACLSALAVAATIAVMQAGRAKAVAFAIGFFVAQLVTCTALVVVGVAATGASRKPEHGLQASLQLLLALVLIGAALQLRRRPRREPPASRARSDAMVARLGRLRLLTAGVAGFVLGIGGPKRLLVTAFAASAITTSGVSDSQQAILVIWYVAVATALVWGPVLLFLVVGGPIVTIMARSETALARRQPQLLEYGLLALAAILLLDAVGLLL